MRERTWYDEMREKCKGMMPTDAYLALTKASMDNPDGDFLELGAGRGASTISLAIAKLDMKGGGRVATIDQFIQGKKSGPHKYNRHDTPNSRERNIEVFKRNLKKFGAEGYVDIYPYRTDTAHSKVGKRTFSGIFIDIDGRIDRDFSLFFNSIDLHGHVVIDDVLFDLDRLGQPRHGGKHIAKANENKLNPNDFLQSLSTHDRLRALGKHYLTRLFIDHYCSEGFLEMTHSVGSTAFCRKIKPRIDDQSPVTEHIAERVGKEFVYRCTSSSA